VGAFVAGAGEVPAGMSPGEGTGVTMLFVSGAEFVSEAAAVVAGAGVGVGAGVAGSDVVRMTPSTLYFWRSSAKRCSICA
jgi:hypothetical protein